MTNIKFELPLVQLCTIPVHWIPARRDQPPPCSQAEDRGALEGVAFAQCPDLVPSPHARAARALEPACLAFVPTGVHAQRRWLLKSSKIRRCLKLRFVGSCDRKLMPQQKGLAIWSLAMQRGSSGHLLSANRAS